MGKSELDMSWVAGWAEEASAKVTEITKGPPPKREKGTPSEHDRNTIGTPKEQDKGTPSEHQRNRKRTPKEHNDTVLGTPSEHHRNTISDAKKRNTIGTPSVSLSKQHFKIYNGSQAQWVM